MASWSSPWSFTNWILIVLKRMGDECWYETFPNVSVQKKESLHWTAECGRKWEEAGYIVTTFWEDTITVTLTIMYRPVPKNPNNIDTLYKSLLMLGSLKSGSLLLLLLSGVDRQQPSVEWVRVREREGSPVPALHHLDTRHPHVQQVSTW